MEQTRVQASSIDQAAVPEAVGGVIAGLVAGAAYLAAQISFTAAAHTGGAAEPLQRIAAILLGPDAAPPPAEFSFTLLGMALIIHFGLAMTFGRIVSTLVWPRRTRTALLVGAGVGLALYAVNFGLIAPGVFPWFMDSLRLVTAIDHVLFGLVAAAVCVSLRSRTR